MLFQFYYISQASIKYTYGLELRPSHDPFRNPYLGFLLPLKYIKPTVEEALAGIKAMAKELNAPIDLETGN